MAAEESPTPNVVYASLDPDAENLAPIEIESVCTECEENGTTKLIMIRIPFYKEVILMSFECPHCGNKNSELQQGGAVSETGASYHLKVTDPADLNRQVVKSEFARVRIPEIDLEIPYKSQPGEITTVEGVIERVAEGLEQDQARRLIENPETAVQVGAFLERLRGLLSLAAPFTLELEDPSGCSFIAPRDATKSDSSLIISHFPRTLDQRKLIGLAADDEEEKEDDDTDVDDWKKEVMSFTVDCFNCGAKAQNDMKIVDIPHFKETVVMGVYCDACGYRTSEVKGASGVSAQGLKMTLLVRTAEDLARDVLKSETARLLVPELELEGGQAVMTGRFTTVEGILGAMKDELSEGSGAFMMGDSADAGERGRMGAFLHRLGQAQRAEIPFTLILDDPAGNSYIQSLDETEADERLTKEWYERSFEQNDDLGLNDMKTEDYTQEPSDSLDS